MARVPRRVRGFAGLSFWGGLVSRWIGTGELVLGRVWSGGGGQGPQSGEDVGEQAVTGREAQGQVAGVPGQPAGDGDEPAAEGGDHGLAAADAVAVQWSPGNFVDISIMLLLVSNCQIGARNPLGLSCRADVVSGRDCNIARCSQRRLGKISPAD